MQQVKHCQLYLTKGGPLTFARRSPEPPESWSCQVGHILSTLRHLRLNIKARQGAAGLGRAMQMGTSLIFFLSFFLFLFFLCPFQDIFQRKRHSSFSPTEQLKAGAFGEELGGVIGRKFYNLTRRENQRAAIHSWKKKTSAAAESSRSHSAGFEDCLKVSNLSPRAVFTFSPFC